MPISRPAFHPGVPPLTNHQQTGPAVAGVVGQPTETDLAQPVIYARAVTVGQAVETSVAQPVSHSRAKALGQALETDSATIAIKGPLAPAPALGSRSLGGGALGGTRYAPTTTSIAIGQAVETDTAGAITTGPAVSPPGGGQWQQLKIHLPNPTVVRVDQAIEIDRALPVTFAKTGLSDSDRELELLALV